MNKKSMALSYNTDEMSQSTLPSTQHDIREAKKFLMRRSPESNDNLYDHLSELLGKIIAERPKNAVDIFEQYSKQLKNERLKQTTGIRDVYVPPLQYEDAQQLVKLFKEIIDKKEKEEDINDEVVDDLKETMHNLSVLFYHLEQIDVGMPRSEIFMLTLSIRKLIKEKSIKNVRFWGKILGRPKNYYVVDAELSEEELLRRQELEADKHHEMRQTQVQDGDGVAMSPTQQKHNTNVKANVGGDGVNDKKKGLDLVFPPIPRSNWKPPPVVTTERIGVGLNKIIYFACNSPGLDEWIELASVTPQQIVAARQIVHCFTGCLKTPMNTFPAFPGNESNYLRAQIARISASTHVSPIGYFIFREEMYRDNKIEEEDEEEDDELEEEEGVEGGTVIKNPNYKNVPMEDLVDPSMSNWCHHREYILAQGRSTWWDTFEKDANEEESSDVLIDDDEEEEEEEEEIENETQEDVKGEDEEEIGPPLLTSLSKDAMVGTMTPAWTARFSSEILPETAIVVIRSNVWPGAITFAKDRIFGNVYIGWGHKFNVNNYSPLIMLPLVQHQYKLGPEVIEMQDPTVEAEGGYQKEFLQSTKLSESVSSAEGEESSEEEEEENDEVDEDDEDDEDEYD